jgi:hypothetical protein
MRDGSGQDRPHPEAASRDIMNRTASPPGQKDANSGEPAASDRAGPLPPISLSKEGGAIRGIGEKFAVNPVTGTGSLTVPIALSPGRSGFGPQLSLSYDSGAGQRPFGFGQSLGLPSIIRKTDGGGLYDSESDT